MVVDDFSSISVTTPNPDFVDVETRGTRLVVKLDCGHPDRKFGVIQVPIQVRAHDSKVKLHFTHATNLPFAVKFEYDSLGRADLKTFEHYFLEYQKGPVFFTLENRFYPHLSLGFRCRKISPGTEGAIFIDKIEIVPRSLQDQRIFLPVLAVLVLLLVLVPGLLAYASISARINARALLTWLTPLSLVCLFALYGVLLLHQKWWSMSDMPVLTAAYVLLLLIFLLRLGIKRQLWVPIAHVTSIKWELLAVFVALSCIAVLISDGIDLPLHLFSHHRLRYLTYGAFGAHDPMFQFVNGIAVLHDEPFSRYYADNKLINPVEDRGILAGVLYAAFRGLASPFDAEIAYSYGYYTLFGSALNILVLLPLFALHRYFTPGRPAPLLVLFLVSASPFVLTNYFLTWFKLAGAGLVLSGILVLLLDRCSIRAWFGAGLLWGLAASFHQSLALGLPLVTIWLMIRFWRSRQNRLWHAGLAFLALMSIFWAVITPWEMVKSHHFENNSRLFRQHFLDSEPYDQRFGLAGSVRNFIERHSLSEQVSRRYENLEQSLRLEEVKSLIDIGRVKGWDAAFVKLNLLETAYVAYVLSPWMGLLLLSLVITRVWPSASWTKRAVRHTRDFKGLLLTQALTLFIIIISSYGTSPPDITWHLPASATLICLYLLVHCNIAVGRAGLVLACGYAALVYSRMFFQYV